ncbi:MAG TPA: hypothetical protein VLT86_00245 [Vicinamibacterales bacterium]|nr:hypothetical protein [Vicinamibacterales bacterium]
MLFMILSLATLAQAALSAQVKLGAPAEVAQVDLGKMGGTFVSQLAWSPDGNQLYLQTMSEDKKALPKDTYHWVIPAEGGAFNKVGAPPEWAAAYWSWKSGQTAPDDPAFKIEISTDKRVASAVALPMGGDLAKGGVDAGRGGGAGADPLGSAIDASTNATVYTLRLKGEIIGEWTNHRIMPGTTFGWGPAGSHLVAYADKPSGHLVVMDSSGAKQKIDDTHGVIAPAWSSDGTRLAYLEGRGRNRYALIVAKITK